jgi:hypothetical protein
MIQADDGNRNALNTFMSEKETVEEMIKFLSDRDQFFKARVVLEMYYELKNMKECLSQYAEEKNWVDTTPTASGPECTWNGESETGNGFELARKYLRI